MELKEAITSRKSIRKFKEQEIGKETLERIVDVARFAPSWKNVQPAEYVVVRDKDIKQKLATECVNGFEYNTKTMQRADAICVVVINTGLSGFEKDGSFSTSKEDRWEVFDAGLATMLFTLAAHDEGIGSVILGIFDEAKVGEVIGLKEGQKAAALIALGYPDQDPDPRPRKETKDLLKVI